MPKRIGRPHQIAQYANAELKKSLRRSKHNPDRTKSSAKFPSSLEVTNIKTNSLSRATIWTRRTRYSGMEELVQTQNIRFGGTHQEPECQVRMKSPRSRTPGMDEVPNQEGPQAEHIRKRSPIEDMPTKGLLSLKRVRRTD